MKEPDRGGDRSGKDRAQSTSRRRRRLPAGAWLTALRLSAGRALRDGVSKLAASLTYYAALAVIPSLVVVVALVGLFGHYPATTDALLNSLRHVGPASLVDTVRGPIEGVVRHKGGAGVLLTVGLLGALWSATGYVGAFIWAADHIYETLERRPFLRRLPLQLAIAAATIAAVAVVLAIVVVSGPIARWLGDLVGLGRAAVDTWAVVKWPLLFVAATLLFAGLYKVAPNVRQPRFRWLTAGAAMGVVIWLAASAGFALYVSQFGHYNATYGSLGAAIVFLLWLWIFNMALLLGAAFDAELERARESFGEPAAEGDQKGHG
jgi:membrane protein